MQEVRVITKTSQDANVIQLRPDVQPPETRQEYEALFRRRSELQDQLGQLQRRSRQSVLVKCRDSAPLIRPVVEVSKLVAKDKRLDAIHTVVVADPFVQVAL